MPLSWSSSCVSDPVPWLNTGVCVQIDAFEGQDGITSPYTHVSSVAQDLKGLLTGSTRVNHKRNTGSLYSIDSVPEVRY